MPNPMREIPEDASQKFVETSQEPIDADGQEIVTGFLRAELDLAFTMLSIAMETGRDADRRAFLNVAPNSINSVRGLAGRITDYSDIQWIRARVHILESAVTRLKSSGASGSSIDRAIGQSVPRSIIEQIRRVRP